VPLWIQKSAAHYATADSDISSQNFSAANSEIGSKTASLPIHKLATNCAQSFGCVSIAVFLGGS